jgi:hypothetical protein
MTLRERFLNQQDPTYIRSRRAYQMKCVENRTLRAIGAELGVSRERARQLVAKYKRTYLSRERWFSRRKKPREMRDLKELNVTRVTRFISYNRMESMLISAFYRARAARRSDPAAQRGPRNNEPYFTSSGRGRLRCYAYSDHQELEKLQRS